VLDMLDDGGDIQYLDSDNDVGGTVLYRLLVLTRIQSEREKLKEIVVVQRTSSIQVIYKVRSNYAHNIDPL
jgi:hypothetical protein